MIRRTLEEWNYNIIRKLVIEGYSETDTFDFKPALKYGNIHLRVQKNEIYIMRIPKYRLCIRQYIWWFHSFLELKMRRKWVKNSWSGWDRISGRIWG